MTYKTEPLIIYEATPYGQALFDYYAEDSKSILCTTFKEFGDKITKIFQDLNIFNPIGTVLSIPLYTLYLALAVVSLALGVFKAIVLLGRHERAKAKLTTLRRHQTPDDFQLEYTLQQIHGKTREMKHLYRSNREIDETAELFNRVRFYLYENNKTLTAKVLKEKHPRITGEELMECAGTGELPRPYLIERITFGNELNESMKVIFKKELEFKKTRGKNETYTTLNNHEYQFIIDKLNYLFMEEGIKIKFDRSELN